MSDRDDPFAFIDGAIQDLRADVREIQDQGVSEDRRLWKAMRSAQELGRPFCIHYQRLGDYVTCDIDVADADGKYAQTKEIQP